MKILTTEFFYRESQSFYTSLHPVILDLKMKYNFLMIIIICSSSSPVSVNCVTTIISIWEGIVINNKFTQCLYMLTLLKFYEICLHTSFLLLLLFRIDSWCRFTTTDLLLLVFLLFQLSTVHINSSFQTKWGKKIGCFRLTWATQWEFKARLVHLKEHLIEIGVLVFSTSVTWLTSKETDWCNLHQSHIAQILQDTTCKNWRLNLVNCVESDNTSFCITNEFPLLIIPASFVSFFNHCSAWGYRDTVLCLPMT